MQSAYRVKNLEDVFGDTRYVTFIKVNLNAHSQYVL